MTEQEEDLFRKAMAGKAAAERRAYQAEDAVKRLGRIVGRLSLSLEEALDSSSAVVTGEPMTNRTEMITMDDLETIDKAREILRFHAETNKRLRTEQVVDFVEATKALDHLWDGVEVGQ